MRAAGILALILVVGVTAAGGGFWFARHQQAAVAPNAPAATATPPSGERKILYYKDPMGKPDFSPVPKQDAMGMDYVAVHEDEETPIEAPSNAPHHDHGSQATGPAVADRTILYYRNPMGLPDTSPVPKKDSMGMDYIPVYADAAGNDSAIVTISPARVQMLGVRTEPVMLRTLIRPLRAVGTIQFSERQVSLVSTRFEGWIEALYVSATGETVHRGEPLMRVYSPILVQTQQEYLDAAAMADALSGADTESKQAVARLAEGALQRLRYLDVPEPDLRRLQRERQASRSIAWPSPVSGIVLEKMAVAGMRFMPGDPLYRIADISPIWVIAQIFEQDLAQVAVGLPATITVKAYPGRSFVGRVQFVYPTVAEATRTGTVRIEIPNPGGELKADMYASVEIETPAATGPVPAVPDSAVIDNGVRQVVLVERGAGQFEPRQVTPGARSEGYTEIRDGVKLGETVVVSANFLIDAESNLKAALGTFTAGEKQQP